MNETGGQVREDVFALRHGAILALAALLYAVFNIVQWSEAYIDFGDGNYLYIATRLTQGVVPYRDILAPQPPCHLFLGAGLVRLSQILGLASPLYVVRAFSLVLHLGTYLLIALLARRAWGSAATGVVAAILYLLLPISLWWSMAFQSEPLEIFLLVAMMLCALTSGLARDAATGLLGALAAMTNATAGPFLLVLILYMLASDWRRAFRIALPAIALAGSLTLLLEIWTGGYFLNNAVFNQAGTYPRGQFLSYAFGKIVREGSDILRLEGPFILLALLGFFRFLKSSPLEAQARGGLAWFCLATMASFVYVTKGGTVDYIFCLAGPALAVLGSGEIVALARRIGEVKDVSLKPALIAALALLTLVVMGLPVMFYRTLWTQGAFELPDLKHAGVNSTGEPGSNVEQVRHWIERYSKPGDTILAPPFYAFLTGRKLWGEMSELFIWRIKDLNDRMDKNAQGEGWAKTLAMAKAIENRELPIVILEMGQQGQLPEVLAALEKSYQLLLKEPYPTLNTRLGIYIPKMP